MTVDKSVTAILTDTVANGIPLEKLCSLEVRELLEIGTPKGSGHNESAIKIAKEVIGVENYCQANGISYQGTARELYESFLVASGIDSDGLTESRWKSAIAANPSPSLSPDKIETCLNAWYRQNGSNYSPRPHAPKAKPQAKAPSFPPIKEPVTLAKFEVIPTDFPQPVKPPLLPQGIPENATQTTYRYSPTQFIKRFDWEDPNKPKGRDKTFRQSHVNSEGDVIWGKGSDPWPLYREPEVIAANGSVLLQEGEKATEAGRELGIIGTTLQGSNWSEDAIAAALTRLKEAGSPGLVFVTDNDDAGKSKGKKVLTASAKTGLPVIVIPITQLWEDAPKAGDLADWIKWGIANGMNTEDFIKRLEAEIHKAVNERQTQQNQAKEPDDWDILVNELKLIQQEPQSAKRKFLLSKLAQSSRIPLSELKKMLAEIDEDCVKPSKNIFSLEEILSLNSKAENWLVPGYLPQGELGLLSAAPKVGKTLMVTDLAKAVLTGGKFLGENVRQGKVLYVTSDESMNSLSRRLKSSGFDTISSEVIGNFQVLTNFDITYQADLQARLHEFRPDLVIFDSLTSISRKAGMSENDAEFSRPIYQLRDALGSVDAAGILIHHDNKSREARGIEKVSGSLRITAAVWGIWRLECDPENQSARTLTITPRETEPSAHRLEINPKPLWKESGIYSYKEEIGDEDGKKRTTGQRILDALKNGDRLEALELKDMIGGCSNIYQVLSRLEDRSLVCTDISKTTGKTVYFLPCTDISNDLHPPKNDDNPPPTQSPLEMTVSKAETITQQELEVTNTSTNTLLTVLLTPATNTSISGGGGGVSLPDENDTVPSQNGDRDDNSLQWDDLIAEIDLLLNKLNWTPDQGREYLLNKYDVKSRHQLPDEQIIEFLNDLKVMAADYW